MKVTVLDCLKWFHGGLVNRIAVFQEFNMLFLMLSTPFKSAIVDPDPDNTQLNALQSAAFEMIIKLKKKRKEKKKH